MRFLKSRWAKLPDFRQALLYLVEITLLVTAYWVTTKISLNWSMLNKTTTALWPVSGVTLVWLLLRGIHLWPGVLIGARIALKDHALTPFTIACFCVGATLEASLGAWILRSLRDFRHDLSRIRDVVLFLGFGAILTPVFNVAFSFFGLWHSNQAPLEILPGFALTFWIGDAIGILLVAPIFMILSSDQKRRQIGFSSLLRSSYGLESLILGLLVFVVSRWVFQHRAPGTFLIYPLLLWTALRFGRVGAFTANLIVAAVATHYTVKGYGPFSSPEAAPNMLSLQLFMGVSVVISYLTAAGSKAEAERGWLSERVEILEREKRAQLLVAESDARFKQLTEAIPQIVWTANSDGFVEYANRRWFEFSGQSPDQCVHTEFVSRLHPNHREALARDWAASVIAGTEADFEYLIQRHDGVYRWHLGRAVPVRDSSGKVQKWFGSITDIHDRKQIEEELKRAVQIREEFLSIASHELKTPLTPLKLHFQTLLRLIERKKFHTLSPELLRLMVQECDREIDRLSHLVSNLLDVSRITAGKLSLRLEAVDLRSLLVDVRNRFTGQSPSVAQLVRVEQGPEPVQGWFDRIRVEQVVTNLFLNSLKYAPGSPIELGAKLNPRDGTATLWIQDEGPGIPERDHGRIFERFERAAPGTNIGGLGLGLYISRKIVQAHGGNIELKSAQGKGAKFTVTLPLVSEPSKGELQAH